MSGLGGLVVFAVFAAAGYLAGTLALQGELFAEQAELLKALVDRGVRDYQQVWRVVKQAYNVGVEEVLNQVLGGGRPWEPEG